MQLKYVILIGLREDFVKIWKKLFGFNSYAHTTHNQNPWEDIIDITGRTIKNNFWQYIYIKMVQLRLFIMLNPYIYIIINFIITYNLIINDYLITCKYTINNTINVQNGNTGIRIIQYKI